MWLYAVVLLRNKKGQMFENWKQKRQMVENLDQHINHENWRTRERMNLYGGT